MTDMSVKDSIKKAFAHLQPHLTEDQKAKFEDVIVEETTEETVEETTEAKFVESSLADGTVVNIEPAIELGASVMVVTDEGEEPAGDGEHTLEGGMVITTEGGLIVDIVESGVEEEPEAEEEMATEEVDPKDAKIAELESRLAELEATVEGFSAITTKLDDLVANQAITHEVIVELASAPKDEPSQAVKNPLKRNSSEERLAKVGKIAQAIRKN